MYGVIMSFREREEWGAVVTSCFAEYGMMNVDVGGFPDTKTIYKYNVDTRLCGPDETYPPFFPGFRAGVSE